VFDYEKLADKATLAEPNKHSEGMRYVVVNGQLVLNDGKLTKNRPGRVLRGPGYDARRAAAAVSTGKSDPRMASFDRIMAAFMQRHRVPGAALAVTDQGRLVHARGCGYADVATREKVAATSLFRIASISKPVTAVAVLQLVEQGRLDLDDAVFDLLDWAELAKNNDSSDERLKSVTVRHLLEHRGGWDRDMSFDGMFRPVQFAEAQQIRPPAGPDAVIRSMFGQRLDFDPGERYAYSNYGYCLLGRIIEKVTGETYEAYVKANVLFPLGIESMVIGRTRLAGQRDNEVRYYDPGQGASVFAEDLNEPVAGPYGAWHLEAMDAHGGWLASAVDLARFACSFDDPRACPILNEESVQLMYARPDGLAGHDKDGKPKPVFYSSGWLNRVVSDEKRNHWHTGSLPGTSTLLVRRHDGRNWVILFNARVSPHTSHLTKEIDSFLHQAADRVTDWPEYDLFDEF
jgi:N-acyl-D-amino-acid deacylase